MKEPNDTDKFFVDITHGSTYHVKSCAALRDYRGQYIELPYSQIKTLTNREGRPFEPHGCINAERLDKHARAILRHSGEIAPIKKATMGIDTSIEIAAIGPVQKLDVTRSGEEVSNQYFRTCTVLQGSPPQSDIGDTSPYRIAKLYGERPIHWNRQFVVQVAGCPLHCWYCYVDNLEASIKFTPRELVLWYKEFKLLAPDIHVLHFMGGCPGRYSYLWKEIRNEMDKQGCEEDVFLTDVILVEEMLYGQKPWNDIPHMSIVQACLKGTNFENFQSNTGTIWFTEALNELGYYIGNEQVYFALIEQSKAGTAWAMEMLGAKNIDFLRVKEYEVVKNRLRTNPRKGGNRGG